jgi:serine/threonine protein kinase/tetratricopeptide (TPR) repeat protein
MKPPVARIEQSSAPPPEIQGRKADSGDEGLVRIVEDLTTRMQAGEPVDVDALIQAHPEYSERLRNLLPALGMLAELGQAPLQQASTGADTPPLAGQLGDFRLIRKVGSGGMGIVYEAEQLSLLRRVALKILPFAATMDPRHLQRFQNEARAAASLHHEHVVPVYGVGQERGVHYYAMQYIEGQTLAAFIEQQRGGSAPCDERTTARQLATPPGPTADTAGQAAASTVRAPRNAVYFRRLAEWGGQAALALEHAHQLGVVHRDIKPANLMLDSHGKLWVTDFGLAQIQSDTRLTMTGDLVGTLRYMSPEQALAKIGIVDHRTDVYSLGATLYELLTLEPVFGGTDRQELLRQIAFEEPRRPRRWNRAIPRELETIVLKAIERNPADRYTTAQELADDLRSVVEDRPIRAKRPSLLDRFGRWRRRHKPLVRSVVALVFTILLLSGAALAWQQRQLAAVELAIGEDLREADLLQRQERWAEELQVLERASGRLAAGGLPHLRERVEERRKDAAMIAKLDEAHLLCSTVGSEGFDMTGAHYAYAAAFASYGLNLETLSPEETAERIRSSPIRLRLVAALDDWGSLPKQVHAGSKEPARVIARLADDDSWRQQLRDPEVRKDRSALERLAEAEGVLTQPPSNLIWLSRALNAVNGRPASERLLRQAQQRYPADFWINFELAGCLYQESTTKAESLEFMRVALALRPRSSAVYNNLGVVLENQKKTAEAEAAYRKAIDLGPGSLGPYRNLGNALRDQKKSKEAEAVFRKAIEIKSDDAEAYYGLGNALQDQKELKKAEEAFRKAIKLKHDYFEAYNNLGIVLTALKKPAEAETYYNQAIKLRPGSADTYYNLGIALQWQKKLQEAEVAYRQATSLRPNFAEAHCNLGQVLLLKGRFDEALAARKRGHELGIQRGTAWAYDSAARIREAERAIELDAKVPKLLRGEAKPADAVECLDIAILCQDYKSCYRTAVGFYQKAFAADPRMAHDLRAGHRYDAARAAVLASCGKGKDADQLNAVEAARLRKQALIWLRADLTAWQIQVQKDKAAPVVLQIMQHWLDDTDFNSVRGADALAKLPEAERGDWQQLWEDVAALRQRAQPKKK